ncbi:MAG: hypothetical protein IT579_14660, partial [Verrucomicrobia subdivision 3 bacterium]|nr:hypothetical protein [Limisphaerales bacterium]
ALTSYTNRTVRVRFQAWSYNGSAPDEDLVLDKITIEDAPPPVLLNPIDEVSVSTLRLTWTPTGLVNFREYRIYRSESSSVTEASILVASFTNQAVMAFVDTGLMARKKYYYRIFLYNNSDTSTGGNQASAMTGGVTVPWSDNFETNAVGWTFTGSWTNWPGGGRNGSMGLLDSPGDYANSADSWAQFAVNLSGTTWPVLRFWDRHALADNDWGRLEISSDAGANWRPVYGVSSTRTNWAEQSIDLSPWRNQSQVWFRFHLFTDGSVPNDGWSVDDVGLAEHVPVAVGYPFYENFENGLTNWLHAGWITDTNAPYGGGYAVHDTVPLRIAPDTTLWLTLAGELNLTNAVDPQLTFWVRGYLWHYSGLRFQVSTDGGLTWAELAAVNLDTGFNADWTRKQVALTSYTNQTVRVRFQTWSYNGSAPDEDIFLDNIGIGEFAPSAPSLHSPRDQGIVGVLRPTLIVNNAIDYQGDPVSYRFEVYADAGLSNLVAQVPVMAAGWNTTAWQVDVNLLDHAQYWWRCLASSGPNISPWMPATSFYINHTNRAPFAVVIPSGWLTLSNTDGVLTWYPTTDPDPGDYVLAYQVQVDDDPDFGSPVIDQGDVQLALPEELTSWLSVSLPLKEFVGADHLQAGHRYYWRVRAVDSYYTLSEWPAGEHWFQFGATVTDPLRLTALSSPDAAGRMTLEWSVTGSRVYVEFKPSLEGLNWQTIAGPLSAHSFTITNSATMPTGFLRLRQE